MMGSASPQTHPVTPGLTRGPAAFLARRGRQAGPRIKSGVTKLKIEGMVL